MVQEDPKDGAKLTFAQKVLATALREQSLDKPELPPPKKEDAWLARMLAVSTATLEGQVVKLDEATTVTEELVTRATWTEELRISMVLVDRLLARSKNRYRRKR